MHRILNEKPAPIEEINPQVPAELRRLIRRCLAKNPEQRFQSMKDLALELHEIVEEWDTLSPSAPSDSGAVGTGQAPHRPCRDGAALDAGRRGGCGVRCGGRGNRVVRRAPAPHRAHFRRRPAPDAGRSRASSAEPNSGRPCCHRTADTFAHVKELAGRFNILVRQVTTGSDVLVVEAAPSVPRLRSQLLSGRRLSGPLEPSRTRFAQYGDPLSAPVARRAAAQDSPGRRYGSRILAGWEALRVLPDGLA